MDADPRVVLYSIERGGWDMLLLAPGILADATADIRKALREDLCVMTKPGFNFDLIAKVGAHAFLQCISYPCVSV